MVYNQAALNELAILCADYGTDMIFERQFTGDQPDVGDRKRLSFKLFRRDVSFHDKKMCAAAPAAMTSRCPACETLLFLRAQRPITSDKDISPAVLAILDVLDSLLAGHLERIKIFIANVLPAHVIKEPVGIVCAAGAQEQVVPAPQRLADVRMRAQVRHTDVGGLDGRRVRNYNAWLSEKDVPTSCWIPLMKDARLIVYEKSHHALWNERSPILSQSHVGVRTA